MSKFLVLQRANWKAAPLKDLNTKNLVAGFIAGLLIVTGPTVLILEASRQW
jgi:hypothetical protein